MILSGPSPSAPAVDNYFAAAREMLRVLEAGIQKALQSAFPFTTMMNMIWFIIGAIFMYHFLETTYHAFRSGTTLGIFNNYKELIRKKFLRILVFASLSMGCVVMVAGGSAALAKAPLGAWASENIGYYLVDWLGANDTIDTQITDEYGKVINVTKVKWEAPVITELEAAAGNASKTIDGLSAAMVWDRINTEIEKTLKAGGSTAANVTTMQTAKYNPLMFIIGPIVEGFFYITSWFTFLWAQWTLSRTILLQALFLGLGWHLGLYFLPIFILLAYFKPMQGFLINLLKNYFSMMIAGYVMAALLGAILSTQTWMGTFNNTTKAWEGGLIQASFDGIKWSDGATLGLEPGTFPWLMKTYARQIARGQIVWLLGACGIIIGQVYDITRGVVDGGFRAYFDGGNGSSVMGK